MDTPIGTADSGLLTADSRDSGQQSTVSSQQSATTSRCPESHCAVQAAYIRFLAAQADEDDARLLVRAGLVEAIYRLEDKRRITAQQETEQGSGAYPQQADTEQPVGFRIPPAKPGNQAPAAT